MTVVIPLVSRRIRKRELLRGRIVSEAVRLFSEQGIDAVTVEQVAEAADVGKGTIYNYFETKEDIVVAFMVDLERTVQGRLRAFRSRKRAAAGVLVDYVLTQFEMKRPYHAFVRVFLAHMFLRTEQFLPYMAEMQKVIDPPLEALFQSLRRRGVIRTDTPLRELVLVFKAMHLGLTALWAVEGPPFTQSERTVERQVRLFCEGLAREERDTCGS